MESLIQQNQESLAALPPRPSLHELGRRYGKSSLVDLLQLLGLDRVYHRAEADQIFYRTPDGEERAVWDFLGGYGSTILGHHPPEVRGVLRRALDDGVPVHAQASLRAGAQELGLALNQLIASDRSDPLTPPPRYHAHLLNTGTEAVEAALKHALMEWSERRARLLLRLERERNRALGATEGASERARMAERLIEAVQNAEPTILAMEGSFHGKTAGSLAVTANSAYSAMYHSRAARTEFLPWNADAALVRSAFDRFLVAATDELSFSSLAAVIFEPVQGEGGVRPMNPAFACELARNAGLQGVPLIADEIQSGLYRTGRALASHGLGLTPDYVTLGKSLGGGYAKVSAFLVRSERYVPEFGLLHSSTFAEDEPSSLAALETVRTLASMPRTLTDRAQRFEGRMREGFAGIMQRHPGVIREVRGRGFLLGVEFAAEEGLSSVLVRDMLASTGYLGYVFASYLLERHGIRVAATLSQGNTLRIEPSAFVPDEAVDACLKAFEELATLVHTRRFLALTAHLWPDASRSPALATSPLASLPAPSRIHGKTGLRKVTFLSHLIDSEHLCALDPLFGALSAADRTHFLEQVGPLVRPQIYYEQIVEGSNGERVQLQLMGIAIGSSFFEKCLRSGDRTALRKVQEGVIRAMREEGATHLGLGQYTSIVSDNGLLLSLDRQWNVTTGNSLTAGFALRSLEQALERRGRRLDDCRVGIVGVAGNICNTLAQLVADRASALTVVHRESLKVSPKFQRAVAEVVKNSRLSLDAIHATSDLADLNACDAVILGTNSSRQLLLPEHLKNGAVVLDISVPSNIHPSVFELRPDVDCFQGGYARMPLGQKLGSRFVPIAEGEIFACMAETLATALDGHQGRLSFGPLSKASVLDALAMADRVGIGLGSLKRTAAI
ncbi:MAG: aminotransferase class III-fold pyridoxal phosphate-dependent enzyme [Bdellovibrionales bacterium]|nr:aminotransferase class III-fold pyridoxal phosphate-dependent enzyme [Bdellovibrionales bacterium]